LAQEAEKHGISAETATAFTTQATALLEQGHMDSAAAMQEVVKLAEQHGLPASAVTAVTDAVTTHLQSK
jgi:hypothetical protein